MISKNSIIYLFYIGPSLRTGLLFVCSYYVGPYGVEAGIYVLIAAVYLFDVVDYASPFSTQCRNQQGNAGTYVWRGHDSAAKTAFVVVTYDCGAVRVAKYYLRSHVDELVDKEQAALEHLLVDKYRTLGLCRNDEEYRQKVGSKARPRGIGYGHYGTVQECLYFVVFLLRNVDVVAALFEIDTHACELSRDNAQIFE